MAGFLVGISVLGAFVPDAYATTEPTGNQHLITIHDGDAEKGIISEKDTLRDVFAESGIVLDARDIVEPGLDEKLIGKNYQVNVYRARPVTVIDGAKKIRVMSAYQTPKKIAQDAGIQLRDEDEATVRLSGDVITNGASTIMTIKRALPVKLTLYGATDVVYTQAATVDAFFKEKNIAKEPRDKVSLPGQQSVVANMNIEVWQEGEQLQTRQESIHFAVRQIQDADHEVGYKHIDTPGKNGKKMVTYQVTIKNGKAVVRKAVQTVVIAKAIDQVEVVGTKIVLPPGSHTDWLAKAGIAASNYGYADYIFTRESGWNPGAASPNGYYGLGQTNITSLSNACRNWQSDPICQIRFFNGYAVSRYGSWEGAYNFWIGHNWW